MHRSWVPLSVVAVVLLGLVAAGRAGPMTAQDATPAALAAHPLVGTWVADPDADNPANPPSVDVFTADGVALSVAAGGAATAGAWEATGPRTATITFVGVFEEEGFGGTFVVRGEVEVDEAGEAFTAPYSFTAVAADGTVLETGQGTARGTRLPVEPAEAAGTPLAAVPTWLPDVDGGTPAAGTPAP